jgi:hypothetical protein
MTGIELEDDVTAARIVKLLANKHAISQRHIFWPQRHVSLDPIGL